MRLSWTLSSYIGKHFLFTIALVLLGLTMLVMVVDMVRNDLSRICKKASVRTEELFWDIYVSACASNDFYCSL